MHKQKIQDSESCLQSSYDVKEEEKKNLFGKGKKSYAMKKSEKSNGSMQPLYDVKAEAERNVLGRRLKETRCKTGLSLNALAKELNAYNIHVQATAIYKWEQGETIPNSYQLFALCRFFGIEDGIRYFSGPLHSGETALNEQGLKKLEEYRSDLIATGRYNNIDPDSNE